MADPCWNILLCDADDVFIRCLSNALKDFKFLNHTANIITANTEVDAFEKLRKNNLIHLVYVSIKMEHEDSGFRIVQFVRENLKLEDTRVMLIVDDMQDDLAKATLQEYEINEILIKNHITPLTIYSSALTSLRAFDAIQNIRKLQSHYEAQLKIFSKFVPELIAPKTIYQTEHHLFLGKSNEQVMGVLFCDIRNFVSLTESFTSSECFNFINSYLNTVIPTVISHGGTIYQILGDGILALFPPSEGKYSDNSLQAGNDIQRTVKAYNVGRKKAGYAPIQVGIGLAYGAVALGISGTSVQMAASAFGRTVALASRLQDMTKRFQAEILMSESLVKELSSRS